MDSYLMCPSGLKEQTQISCFAITLNNFEMCNRRLPAFNYSHLLAILVRSSYRRVYCSFVRSDNTVNQSSVLSYDLVPRQHVSKLQMSLIILAGQHNTGGILVNTMNNSRSDNAVDIGQLISAVSQKSVDKCPFVVTCGGVNNHSLRLVDDKNITVFVENIQRNILRSVVHNLRLRY